MLSAVQRGLCRLIRGYASYYVIEVIFPIMLLMEETVIALAIDRHADKQVERPTWRTGRYTDRQRIRETNRQAGR